jgi:CBS domain-containing protein
VTIVTPPTEITPERCKIAGPVQEACMKASELMTPQPASCAPGDSVQDAAKLMDSYDVGSLPVVEGGDNTRLAGIVTDRDITVRAVATGNFDAKVSDVMTANPSTVREDDDVASVAALMSERQVRRIPVVNASGAVVGMIAQADLALTDGPVSDREVGQVVERISEPEDARVRS